ncbi:hypothetical protein CROQUDRAFT_651259 [Cronartium quercuum f. sp. fusiforme G11]|uniref:SMODS and SLOG-associating 2TM effector domain-containing protein n=1 Tax=Cronartium quercuum f. sp. fusiforme G11 TaxID=708437 RepID=A0A9P6TGV5_9BASI|nr:hypothetical protein CROQUDRAFT_651259 [Cronartium quercuum f. sp. fusiforme G11]
MANSTYSQTVTMFLGTVTTIAGTIVTGLRTTGQPKRAQDRFKRLDKIIDHITRLYYEFGKMGPTHPGINNSLGQDENGVIERAIEETWKMIDDEDIQTELDERRFIPFGYSTGLAIQPDPELEPNQSSSGIRGNIKLKLSNSSPTRRNLLEQGRGGRPLLTSARSQRSL